MITISTPAPAMTPEATLPFDRCPRVRLTLIVPGRNAQYIDRFAPAGPDMGFAATIHIPPATQPGTATITDDRSDPGPATFTFKIDGS